LVTTSQEEMAHQQSRRNVVLICGMIGQDFGWKTIRDCFWNSNGGGMVLLNEVRLNATHVGVAYMLLGEWVTLTASTHH
jgi:hypothetical protein